jgi:predicted DNA-binding transcriptional regulator AlpA
MSKLADYNESEVLTFNSLLALLSRRSRQSIYDLMRRDPSFPRPRQIGGEFSIGWLRGEVMEWLNSRPPVELNGLDAVERRRMASGARPASARLGKLMHHGEGRTSLRFPGHLRSTYTGTYTALSPQN